MSQRCVARTLGIDRKAGRHDGSLGIRRYPDKKLPCRTLDNRLVGTVVKLADGSRALASLGNLDVKDRLSTQHFTTLAIEVDGEWVHLARYHDIDFDTRGSKQFAKKLGKSIDEIFPISFDVREYVADSPTWLRGTIEADPKEKLNDNELVKLSLL